MKPFDYSLLAKRALALICICLLAAAALVPLLGSSQSACATQQPGEIDLSSCTFDDSSIFTLDGEWEFYWQQLLDPQENISGTAEAPAYLSVPGIWTPRSEATGFSRYGYATYRLLVQLPPDIHAFALKVTSIRFASTVFVNGNSLGASGTPGTSSQSTEPRNNPYFLAFSTNNTHQAEILIHTANFTYTNGGIPESIRIGTPSSIGTLDKRNSTYDIVLIAGFAFIGLYFLGQGFQRKEDNSSLQLAMYCFTIALYMMTHSEKLLFEYFPSISYEVFSKLQSISSVVGFYFVSSYTYSLFPSIYSLLFRRITLVYSLGFCVIVLTSTIRVYSRVTNILLIFSLISICYTFYVMAKAAWRRETGSYYLLIGVIAAFLFTTSLSANLFLGTGLYAIPPVSGPIFILAEGLFLSARHAHAYQKIKQLSLQLERKDRDKDEFLFRTSTQLRTPLNAIINISLSMYEGAGGPLSPSQREDMRLILGTGRRLAFLVRDIVDYEQIKRELITLHRDTVDVQGVAEIVIEVFRFLNKNGEIRIKNRIPPAAFLVHADEQRLMQILYNLLDNALKFTDRGSVIIEAAQLDDSISVTVSDTGRGIPEEQLENIFRDYEQVNEADSLETGGLGLGLAITRKLVELHGEALLCPPRLASEAASPSRFPLSRLTCQLPGS